MYCSDTGTQLFLLIKEQIVKFMWRDFFPDLLQNGVNK